MEIDFESIQEEIYELCRTIKDPEFPQTLEELKVIQKEKIQVENKLNYKLIKIFWVPTVPHCTFASQIGLSIRAKLERELTNYFYYKIEILVEEGTHQDKYNLDKQLNDKERYSSAQENKNLMKFIDSLIE